MGAVLTRVMHNFIYERITLLFIVDRYSELSTVLVWSAYLETRIPLAELKYPDGIIAQKVFYNEVTLRVHGVVVDQPRRKAEYVRVEANPAVITWAII